LKCNTKRKLQRPRADQFYVVVEVQDFSHIYHFMLCLSEIADFLLFLLILNCMYKFEKSGGQSYGDVTSIKNE
jgi:hypothetical protein